MRLIDANELYKTVSDGKYTIGNIFKDMELQEFIKDQPTAYDIGEVVEKLEYAKDNCDLRMNGKKCTRREQFAYEFALSYAIEVVKGGAK